MEKHITSLIAKGSLIAGCAFLLTAATSVADYITFSTSVGLQPSNVGTITLTQVDADTVDVLLDLSAPYGFLNTGGPHTPFAFSISGSEAGVSASFIKPSGGAYTFGLFTLDLGGGGGTPYGSYGVAIDDSAGNGSGKAYYGDLEFQLTRTSGLSITDFVANSAGYYFAADLTNGAQNTGSQAWMAPGPVVTQNGNPVPDGGTTWVLLGVSVLGIALVNRALRGSAVA